VVVEPGPLRIEGHRVAGGEQRRVRSDREDVGDHPRPVRRHVGERVALDQGAQLVPGPDDAPHVQPEPLGEGAGDALGRIGVGRGEHGVAALQVRCGRGGSRTGPRGAASPASPVRR
jgi:hypothetical protein